MVLNFVSPLVTDWLPTGYRPACFLVDDDHQNLPEGALSLKPEMGRLVTPSSRPHVSGGNFAAQGGSTPTGDDGRPSPVRITRVFGGGLQVCGRVGTRGGWGGKRPGAEGVGRVGSRRLSYGWLP